MNRKIFLRLAFRQYNRARKVVERKRLHRALSLLLTNDGLRQKCEQYHTTAYSCQCPDCQNRSIICYHQAAFVMNYHIWQDVQKIWIGEVV